MDLKDKCIFYKGSKCEKCGYNKCIDALHFHHLDPLLKEFAISKRTSYSFDQNIKNELDKCQLLYANCHAEIHSTR